VFGVVWDDAVTSSARAVMRLRVRRSKLAIESNVPTSLHWRQQMHKTRHIKLAVLFGAYSAILVMLVSIAATALMGTSVSGKTLLSAAIDGAVFFIVSFLTVLFVWPRIGFEPLDFQRHEHTR
jgi:CBS domain containing-hemolysin-like protein